MPQTFSRTRPPADSRVPVLRVDAELAQAVASPLVEKGLRVPALWLEPGPWSPGGAAGWEPPVWGALVARGVLIRETRIGERCAAELVGPGDIVDPWAPTDPLLGCEVTWRVQQDTTLAVLDRTFDAAARRWPELLRVLHERSVKRQERLAAQAAALQLPHVEARVMAVLAQAAERFGHVTPSGIVIQLRLTHQLLGELAGAQRPTVTLALQKLRASGAVREDEQRQFVLPMPMPAVAAAVA